MISAVVMAHPGRAERAQRLAADLGIPIVWDERNDVIDTCLRALQAYDPAATHHLVLQDDAIACRDLLAGLTTACDTAGDLPVVPYLGTYGPGRDPIGRLAEQADRAGASWVEFFGPRWGVAVAHPVALLPKVIRQYEAGVGKADDARLTAVYRQLRVPCRFTMPSLVDHDDDLPSLTKPGWTGHHKRVAFRFIGADRSALDVDWGRPVYRK